MIPLFWIGMSWQLVALFVLLPRYHAPEDRWFVVLALGLLLCELALFALVLPHPILSHPRFMAI